MGGPSKISSLWSNSYTKLADSLKWYYDQKITSFFPSDFKRVFVSHLTGKILRFEFYPKAFFFSASLGFHGPSYHSRSRLTDWTSEGWIEDKMTSTTHYLKIAACKRSLLYMQTRV